MGVISTRKLNSLLCLNSNLLEKNCKYEIVAFAEGGEAGEEVGNDDNDDCYEPGADMEDIDNQSDSCGKLNVNGLNKYFKSIPKNANYAQ